MSPHAVSHHPRSYVNGQEVHLRSRINEYYLAFVKRHWQLVVGCTATIAAIAFLVSSLRPTTYSAESVFVVQSANGQSTLTAQDANALAQTYAQLIPHDSDVLAKSATRLNVSQSQVESAISATNPTNSAVVKVGYVAKGKTAAVNGSKAVAESLADKTTANFAYIALSRLGDSAVSNNSGKGSFPMGAFIGLCLGLVLAVIRERIDGTVNTLQDLSREVSCPVTRLEELTNEGIVALLERWQTLSLEIPATVALVPATLGYQSLSHEVARVFDTTLKHESRNESKNATNNESSNEVDLLDSIVLVSSGAAGNIEVGQAAAQRADLFVLLAPQSMPTRYLRKSLHELADYGLRPAWALLAGHNIIDRARRSSYEEQSVVDIRPLEDLLTQTIS